MGRQSNREERQNQVIEAMKRLMSERGYAGSSVKMIAAEAGLTQGLLHYHFSSKEEILLGVVASISALMRQRFESALEGKTSAEEKMRAYVDAHVGLSLGVDVVELRCWVSISTEAMYNEEVAVVYREILATELGLLEGLLEELHPGREDRAWYRDHAAGVFSLIQGAYQMGMSAGEVLPTGYAKRTIETYIEGLG